MNLTTRGAVLFVLQFLLVVTAGVVAGGWAAVFTFAGMASGTAVAVLLADVVLQQD